MDGKFGKNVLLFCLLAFSLSGASFAYLPLSEAGFSPLSQVGEIGVLSSTKVLTCLSPSVAGVRLSVGTGVLWAPPENLVDGSRTLELAVSAFGNLGSLRAGIYGGAIGVHHPSLKHTNEVGEVLGTFDVLQVEVRGGAAAGISSGALGVSTFGEAFYGKAFLTGEASAQTEAENGLEIGAALSILALKGGMATTFLGGKKSVRWFVGFVDGPLQVWTCLERENIKAEVFVRPFQSLGLGVGGLTSASSPSEETTSIYAFLNLSTFSLNVLYGIKYSRLLGITQTLRISVKL